MKRFICFCLLFVLISFTGIAAAEDPSGPAVNKPTERPLRHARNAVFDLRLLPQRPPVRHKRPELMQPTPHPTILGIPANFPFDDGHRPVITSNTPAPSPTKNFAGLDFGNWGSGWPPDTNGDVGPTYYIQTINSSVGVYRKSDGVQVAAFTLDTFMSQGNFGNPCDANNMGDPVVLYDTFEDRWIVTDFAFETDLFGNIVDPPGAYQCFAVSMTGDPVSGGWNFYSLNTAGGLGDYPKLGIWPDGLYMSVNMFDDSGSFLNARLYAFNKFQMYAGEPTGQGVSFDLPSTEFTALPANARVQTGTPPVGSPNYFATVWNYSNVVGIWKLHVNWNSVSLSSLTGPFNATTATSWSTYASSVPSPANNLDSLSPRLMVQNQYTNIGGVESVWESHTVGASGTNSFQSAVRFYQVNVTGGNVASNATQAATWSPDTTVWRFMPSAAVDRAGNMSIGYSGSSSTLNPAIRYAGRLSTDSANTMSQTETSLIEGTGTQQGACGSALSACERWGDYSAMSVDPDGCTFWYTNEYYATSGLNYLTRIGAFRYSQCTVVGSGGVVSGTVRSASNGSPLSGATVELGSRMTTADVSGHYSFTVPAGTYPIMTASSTGFAPKTILKIVVTDGGTATRNFALRNGNGSVIGDFNADSRGDIFWRNASSQQQSLWLMNGTSPTFAVIPVNVPGPWTPVAFGDFDGDGTTDVFWQNPVTGQTSIWLGWNGSTFLTEVSSLTLSPSWHAMSAGDINGDGMSDLFWYNSSNGQTGVWLMNGIVNSAAIATTTVPTAWTPAVFGDFDGDGKADVFWHNASTGETSIWLGWNGSGYSTQVRGLTIPTAWIPVGAGDIDGDGKSDIFWYNTSTGETSIWFMNGTTFSSAVRSTTVPTSWRPVWFGDFSSDYRTGIFWRNASTGDTSFWLDWNGTSWTSQVRSRTVPTSWAPAASP